MRAFFCTNRTIRLLAVVALLIVTLGTVATQSWHCPRQLDRQWSVSAGGSRSVETYDCAQSVSVVSLDSESPRLRQHDSGFTRTSVLPAAPPLFSPGETVRAITGRHWDLVDVPRRIALLI